VAGTPPFTIFPLGDAAATIDLGNCIDEQHNRRALALYDWLHNHRFPGILDIIMAYSSVSVFFDAALIRAGDEEAGRAVFCRIKDWLAYAWASVEEEDVPEASPPGPLVRIPVCYEPRFAPDMEWVARQTGLSPEEVISIHCATTYRVYMIGFLPGFPYMGKVDERLVLRRKNQPVHVFAGGVGIAGMQTGIYSLNSPGGWQIIGRTPVQLFDPWNDPPVRLQTGDRVQFYPVTPAEFEHIGAS
jgi:inhibitor of KinA